MSPVAPDFLSSRSGWRLFALALLVTVLVYWPGLYGGWLFDDFPNIVDNHGVQPSHGDIPSLVGAALSSPASDFKRPLSSLSFAANYLSSGLDPFWMKFTNLVIHLINGVLVFLLARKLVHITGGETSERGATVAALVAAAWLLLPINLTSVLYVVQRMESMANLFVLAGLLGYLACRKRMVEGDRAWWLFPACVAYLVVMTAVGLLAKETAVMLPLYALILECIVFRFRRTTEGPRDWRIVGMFVVVLVLPLLVGLAWLAPGLVRPISWATRDFTMGTRLLTEMRVVMDYVAWCLVPLPNSLSFYHDDYIVSTGLLFPWTTLTSLVGLVALLAIVIGLRRRQPLVSLGVGLFLGCHLLTATVLPLELVYEHRNYFASFGLVLALVTLLAQVRFRSTALRSAAALLLGALFLWWTALTAFSSFAWGDPLALSQLLASRGPESPRAQYELGRTYIIYSEYDPNSPYTKLAYAPLERAAALPRSSILPQQALIFMNARMNLPLKDIWWDSMIAKLASHKPGVQDESSLVALTQCAAQQRCDLPKARVVAAFTAALNHPSPSARLLAAYGDYAWNVLGDQQLGECSMQQAIAVSPGEAAYRITLIRMLVAMGKKDQAADQFTQLNTLNVGGHLNTSIEELRNLLHKR